MASITPMVPVTTETTVSMSQPARPEAPKVIPAVAWVRVLQLESSKQDEMIPDIKLGSGAWIKLFWDGQS
jgi:hypothetical protein